MNLNPKVIDHSFTGNLLNMRILLIDLSIHKFDKKIKNPSHLKTLFLIFFFSGNLPVADNYSAFEKPWFRYSPRGMLIVDLLKKFLYRFIDFLVTTSFLVFILKHHIHFSIRPRRENNNRIYKISKRMRMYSSMLFTLTKMFEIFKLSF